MPLGPEPLALVVRPDHRLLSLPAPGSADVLAHDWVLPEAGTLLHDAVQDRLAQLGLPAPEVRITSSSALLTLALVGRSNAVAPLARAVAGQFAGAACAILPVEMGLSVAPYGLITRRDALLPKGACRLRNMLMAGSSSQGG